MEGNAVVITEDALFITCATRIFALQYVVYLVVLVELIEELELLNLACIVSKDFRKKDRSFENHARGRESPLHLSCIKSYLEIAALWLQ